MIASIKNQQKIWIWMNIAWVVRLVILFGQNTSDKLLTHSIHGRKNNNDKFELNSSKKKLKYVSPIHATNKKSKLLSAISGYFHHCCDILS